MTQNSLAPLTILNGTRRREFKGAASLPGQLLPEEMAVSVP